MWKEGQYFLSMVVYVLLLCLAGCVCYIYLSLSLFFHECDVLYADSSGTSYSSNIRTTTRRVKRLTGAERLEEGGRQGIHRTARFRVDVSYKMLR